MHCAYEEKGYSATMKTGYVSLFHFLIAITVGSIGATAFRAQDYARDSEPKLFSYDELVQLSLNQEMSPELAEKLRLITTTPFINNEAYLNGGGTTTVGSSWPRAFPARSPLEH